jgi:hypothetical protein
MQADKNDQRSTFQLLPWTLHSQEPFSCHDCWFMPCHKLLLLLCLSFPS